MRRTSCRRCRYEPSWLHSLTLTPPRTPLRHASGQSQGTTLPCNAAPPLLMQANEGKCDNDPQSLARKMQEELKKVTGFLE